MTSLKDLARIGRNLGYRLTLLGSSTGPGGQCGEAKLLDEGHNWTRNTVPVRARSFTRLKPGSG